MWSWAKEDKPLKADQDFHPVSNTLYGTRVLVVVQLDNDNGVAVVGFLAVSVVCTPFRYKYSILRWYEQYTKPTTNKMTLTLWNIKVFYHNFFKEQPDNLESRQI